MAWFVLPSEQQPQTKTGTVFALDPTARVDVYAQNTSAGRHEMDDTIQQTDFYTEEDLRGTLAHTSLVDLLQLLNAGNRTGELDVRSKGHDEKATVYFTEGHLSHATTGELAGIDALAELLRWEDGSFRFSPNVVCLTTSIDRPFQGAIMEAARRLDEETPARDRSPRCPIRRELRDFLRKNDFASHAYLIGRDGGVDVSGTDRDEALPWLDTLRKSLAGIIADYPRRQLNRVIFDDAEGTLIVSCLDERSALLVAAKKTATLGTVVMGVDRLTRSVRRVHLGGES